MAAAVAVIVLLPLFFASAGCRTQDVHAILLKVVDAIEKLIKFYRTSYQNLNLDGLFGLKVIEGTAALKLFTVPISARQFLSRSSALI